MLKKMYCLLWKFLHPVKFNILRKWNCTHTYILCFVFIRVKITSNHDFVRSIKHVTINQFCSKDYTIYQFKTLECLQVYKGTSILKEEENGQKHVLDYGPEVWLGQQQQNHWKSKNHCQSVQALILFDCG